MVQCKYKRYDVSVSVVYYFHVRIMTCVEHE